MAGACLDGALEPFAGYVAAEELSEGPSCVRSAVDNRQYTRMRYTVLDHDPKHDDLIAFLGRFKTALADRNCVLKGITTDGSALSREPIRQVFGEVPPQRCPFHVLKEVTQGVLPAVAKARARLAKSTPTLGRGRPSSHDKAARRLARKSKAMQQKISDVCRERFWFVKRRVTHAERNRCLHLTRGLSPLRKLREIMDHISAWFERRCRTQTALGKLKKLRQWVRQFTGIGETFQKVFSPHLEKALTFLDDTVLPATSKAVERGNRRYRKRHKSVYRGRSKVC